MRLLNLNGVSLAADLVVLTRLWRVVDLKQCRAGSAFGALKRSAMGRNRRRRGEEEGVEENEEEEEVEERRDRVFRFALMETYLLPLAFTLLLSAIQPFKL